MSCDEGKETKITNLLDLPKLATTRTRHLPDSCTLAGTHDCSSNARLSIETRFADFYLPKLLSKKRSIFDKMGAVIKTVLSVGTGRTPGSYRYFYNKSHTLTFCLFIYITSVPYLTSTREIWTNARSCIALGVHPVRFLKHEVRDVTASNDIGSVKGLSGQ